MRRLLLVLFPVLLSACDPALPFVGQGSADSDLTWAQKAAISEDVKAVAAQHGLTNPVLIAGVANAETGMAHCWKDADWNCKGPASTECGGPILAGSGDGACSLKRGGLGMFQFDAGSHTQTLAMYGERILSTQGDADAGVQLIIKKVRYCPNTPVFTGTAGVITWINGARPGTADYDTFMAAMAWCYNGCAPGWSCDHDAAKARYADHTESLVDAFGPEFWGLPAGG